MLVQDSEPSPLGFSLYNELARPAETEEAGEEGQEGDDAAMRSYQTWEPPKANGGIGLAAQPAAGPADVVALLVSIYGSKELFISEYRLMLMDRLLSKQGYDCSREIRVLELLKLRFGEAPLHSCEVMLRDLADSRRTNTAIQQLPASAGTPHRSRRRPPDVSDVTASIISGLFWPKLPDDSVKLHPKVQDKLDAYSKRYYVHKAPRKLIWQPALGQVSLSLQLGQEKRDFTVSPTQASILLFFQEKAEWKAAKLAQKLDVTLPVLRKRIAVWLAAGAVTISQSATGRGAHTDVTYKRAETFEQPERGPGAPVLPAEALEAEDDAAAASAAAQKEEMKVYEQYIMGMLTNFSAGLPLDRIHNMLKMFVSEPPYDKSAAQLEAFLGRLVNEEKLAFASDLYTKRA